MIRSLQSIVLSATVSTITIAVAADSPPRKVNSVKRCCSSTSGSSSTMKSASTVARREAQQAGERDRQHEQVDHQQVEREQPDRLVEVVLVDVLDHRDLELAGQEQDRHAGEAGQREPVGEAEAGAGEGQELAVARGDRLVEDVAEAVEQARR